MFSILNDATWAAGLVNLINIAHNRASTDERRYYGVYNKLLSYLFSNDDYRFVVCPQPPPDDGSCESVGFAFYVLDTASQGRPVMIVEIKDDTWLMTPSKRKLADQQMRDRYDEMLRLCPIPRLWSLSIIGIKVRVYRGDTVALTIDPARVEYDSRFVVPSDYLENEWAMDITTQAGFDRVKQVVTDIYTEIEDL